MESRNPSQIRVDYFLRAALVTVKTLNRLRSSSNSSRSERPSDLGRRVLTADEADEFRLARRPLFNGRRRAADASENSAMVETLVDKTMWFDARYPVQPLKAAAEWRKPPMRRAFRKGQRRRRYTLRQQQSSTLVGNLGGHADSPYGTQRGLPVLDLVFSGCAHGVERRGFYTFCGANETFSRRRYGGDSRWRADVPSTAQRSSLSRALWSRQGGCPRTPVPFPGGVVR